MRWGIVVGSILLASLGPPSSRALAAKERLGVDTFEVVGAGATPGLTASLRAGLVEGLAAAGAEVIPEAKLMRGETGVTALVRGIVEVTGTNYRIAFAVLDPSGTRELDHMDDRCTSCSPAEAQKAVTVVARTLAGRIGRTPSPSSDETRARARSLDEAGAAAFAAGRFEEAARNFEDAYSLTQQPLLLWNIAQSYRRQYEIDHDVAKLRRARLVLRNFATVAPTPKDKKEAESVGSEIDAEIARRTAEAPTANGNSAATAAPAAALSVTPEKKPLSRRWQLWLGVGLGAAAVIAVAVAVGVTQSNSGTDFWSRAKSGCTSPSCATADYRP